MSQPRKTEKEIRQIVAAVNCAPYMLNVVGLGTDVEGDMVLSLQLSHERYCSVTGEPKVGKGRKWHLSRYMNDDEIIRTALMACLAMAEHEIREKFSYHGAALYNPHISIGALTEVCDQRESRA